MIDISKRIEIISKLLDEDSRTSIVYAALECRLTIEAICYERFAISYEYIPHDLLRKWQPHHVVKQVAEEGNEQVTEGFTMFISKSPTNQDNPPVTCEDYESVEYVSIGSQAALDLGKLGKLWNALSNTSLHVSLPHAKGEEIEIYRNSEKVKGKIAESLNEFKKILDGNLLSSGFGEEYYFNCIGCDTKLKKRAKLIKHGEMVVCLNPDCPESYYFSVEDGEIFHIRRLLITTCADCGNSIEIPARFVDKLKFGQTLNEGCSECGYNNQIRLIPGRATKPEAEE
ncbi:MAG: hypothetical protein HRT78_01160 [Halomonas sp.]|jgi:hypothetical protein|uniref:Uncharacterized protein n=1 Tax=Vreelandella glaciei TaxID=186761 RepID=A0A7Z0LSX2_9GAMM|nr:MULTISPECIES: hypothetical protein [Halomonas]NQY75742.1 hypothetical protein [Halomonas sp.]NYS77974.1 hypothetical protein [Halomonas glaciei]